MLEVGREQSRVARRKGSGWTQGLQGRSTALPRPCVSEPTQTPACWSIHEILRFRSSARRCPDVLSMGGIRLSHRASRRWSPGPRGRHVGIRFPRSCRPGTTDPHVRPRRRRADQPCRQSPPRYCAAPWGSDCETLTTTVTITLEELKARDDRVQRGGGPPQGRGEPGRRNTGTARRAACVANRSSPRPLSP